MQANVKLCLKTSSVNFVVINRDENGIFIDKLRDTIVNSLILTTEMITQFFLFTCNIYQYK